MTDMWVFFTWLLFIFGWSTNFAWNCLKLFKKKNWPFLRQVLNLLSDLKWTKGPQSDTWTAWRIMKMLFIICTVNPTTLIVWYTGYYYYYWKLLIPYHNCYAVLKTSYRMWLCHLKCKTSILKTFPLITELQLPSKIYHVPERISN